MIPYTQGRGSSVPGVPISTDLYLAWCEKYNLKPYPFRPQRSEIGDTPRPCRPRKRTGIRELLRPITFRKRRG